MVNKGSSSKGKEPLPQQDEPQTPKGRNRNAQNSEPGSFTPRQEREQANEETQIKMRAMIAKRMKEETVYCTDEDFISHYLPPIPNTVSLDTIVEDLEKSKFLHKSQAHTQDLLGDFSVKPSEVKKEKGSAVNEKIIFAPLADVATAIRSSAGASKNAFQMRMVPDKELQSEIRGCTFKIDACTTAAKKAPGTIHLTDIVVPFEFKILNIEAKQQENRLQLVSTIVHIMNDDIRRNFAFGITIEDDRVSLWYFSRTHSVKATSFSFLKEPKKLVHVLTALCCATDVQLGYDPRITLLPDKSYLYEFPITKEDNPTSIKYVKKESGGSAAPSAERDTSPMPDALYFRTNASLSEVRAFRVAGRTTRILKGKQVISKKNPKPIPGAVDVVLKDIWIGADSLTEVQIQEQLFEDIESFATSSKDWKTHALLQGFSDDDKAMLGAWLPNAGYKDLFLCADRESVGEPNIAVHGEAWDSNDIFREEVLTQEPGHIGTPRTGLSQPATSAPPRPARQSDSPSHRRAFSPKKRCFYLFRDVCAQVSALPTLGVAMDVLRQTHLALILMFCAGWVHRDISAGNVLAIKKGESLWQTKLADLEYARRFPSEDAGSTDPKTGTPYFMAWEIQSSYSLYEGLQRTSRRTLQELSSHNLLEGTGIKVVKKHTYAHELESLWWLILYVITNYVGHRDSYKLARPYFQDNSVLARRGLLVSGGLPIRHPQLSGWEEPLNLVRVALYEGYKTRNPIDVEDPGQYPVECASFNLLFTAINAEEVRRTMASLTLRPTDETPKNTGADDVEQASSPTGSISKKRKVQVVEDEPLRANAPPLRRSNRRTTTKPTSSASKADIPGPSKKPRT